MTALLKTKDLDIRIGETIVCRQLNWTVNSHEIWGIMGLNGIGKSTLLKTLAGLRSADKGQLEIQGQLISSYSRRQMAQLCGYLFQELPHEFPYSLLEYCSAALHPELNRWQKLSEQHQQKIHRALQLVELDSLPHRQLNTLSGGEQRRAEIACLLIQNPRIWFLDEPLNHLDMHHQITMMQQLVDAAHNNAGSIITIMHDANLVLRYCTHVLLIHGNGKTTQGVTEQILNQQSLSSLFNHPITTLHENGKTAFLPA